MKDGRLEASDLMIGDWVDVRCDAAPNTPHIERITPAQFLRDETWLPIPLTKEILEKNGFTLEHYSGDVMTGYWWTRNDFVIHNSMNDAIGRNIFKYEYVHQLQHALRLCGIDKKIEL